MDMTTVDRTIAEILRDLVDYTGPVSNDLRAKDVPNWDSVAHISIVEELESRFSVKFSTEEMVELTGLAAIKAALARHGVASATA